MSELILSVVRDRHFNDTTLKHVLGRLAWEARDDGTNIIVSIEGVADDCDLSPNTIRRALRMAERIGVLRLEERERGPWPRVYSIDVPYLAAAFPLTRSGARRLAQRRGAA